VVGTILGSGIWVWLMARHPAGLVAPFSMLVPVTGLLAGWALLGETPTWLALLGGVLVIGGVLAASVRRGQRFSTSVQPDQPRAVTSSRSRSTTG
jgi:O-acetylserine/cysteine efflux transporter